VDLTDKDNLAKAFRAAKPAVVIHAAALSTIIHCFGNPQAARQINVQATAQLAELADQANARLLLVSTDLVFDGERGGYCEQDTPAPQTVYGQSKAAAEQAVLASLGGLVVRVSLLFGPSLVGRPTLFDEQTSALREKKKVCPLYEDEWRTPLGLVTAAQGLVAIATSDFRGMVHMGGPERMSRLDMGRRLAAILGYDPAVLVPSTRLNPAFTEPRPRDTSLDSRQWRRLFPSQPWPTWEEAISGMIA
jgi:dTDP-4-dehydrorhamnose reductase